MTTIERRASPFDSIRYEDEDGEYWYARELAVLMGYEQWRHFNTAINRARTSMSKDRRYDVRDHFWMVKRPAEVSVGKATKTSDLGGRPSLDYRLTKTACYFVAVNGDPKKKQVALAQEYFVVRAMQAEAIEKVLLDPEPSSPVTSGMPTHVEALRGWADALEGQQKAERLVEELRPPAEAWRALAAGGGDCSVAEAASILNRDPGVITGSGRLFKWLEEMKMIYRRGDGQLLPYSEHQAHLRLRINPSGFPEIRVTPDGLSWVLQRLRQQQTRPALTAVPEQHADVVPIRRP